MSNNERSECIRFNRSPKQIVKLRCLSANIFPQCDECPKRWIMFEDEARSSNIYSFISRVRDDGITKIREFNKHAMQKSSLKFSSAR